VAGITVIPGRPSADGLTWVVYAEGAAAPQLRLRGPGAGASAAVVHPLGRAALSPVSNNLRLVATRGLAADAEYELTAAVPGVGAAAATSRTLPAAIAPGTPFTVAFGSCYCLATDPGIAACYPPALHRAGGPDPVRLRFAGGDQIYMDLSPDSGSPLVFTAPEPWERYRQQWTSARYRPFLSASPTLVQADDHEFWNDYPHDSAWLRWAESEPRGPLGRSMEAAFARFQAPLNVDPAAVVADPHAIDVLLRDAARTFPLAIGPLRFFVLDTRTRRTRFNDDDPHFAKPEWLDAAVAWLAALDGPGVLVVSQPMVETPASWYQNLTHTMGDVNLPDYEADFARLWEAVFAAPHDVLVLSGDIHWSRVYALTRAGRPGRRVYEAISSPFARIPSGDAKDPGSHGQVEWSGGRAGWTRRRVDVRTRSTYSTVSLVPLGAAPASGLRARVTAWQAGGDPGVGAVPLWNDEFLLK